MMMKHETSRPPQRQHDGDAAVTHGRTPVERSAHRAPSEACPSHVVRAEQVGQGGPAGMGGCGSGILGGLLGGARRRQAPCGGYGRRRCSIINNGRQNIWSSSIFNRSQWGVGPCGNAVLCRSGVLQSLQQSRYRSVSLVQRKVSFPLAHQVLCAYGTRARADWS